jgi:hypothetical protein
VVSLWLELYSLKEKYVIKFTILKEKRGNKIKAVKEERGER